MMLPSVRIVRRGIGQGPGRLRVTGIVNASGGAAITCQCNIQYEHGKDPARSCYHTLYYTAMNEILSTEYSGAQLVG
jgi:hypothetical protein